MNMTLGDTRLIIDECKSFGCLRNQAAYILATAYWESGRTMKPVREAFASSDQQAMSWLENAWKKGRLKWVRTPYWREGWFGRGYVQLTHKANYETAEEKLGLPFVSNPSIALQSGPAARVLVWGSMEGWFTGKKIGDYITLGKSEFRKARRVINGNDRASEIAKIAREYDEALEAEGYGVSEIEAVPQPVAKPEVHKPLIQSKEMLMGVSGLVTALTAFLEQLDGSTVALLLGALAVGFMANRLYDRYRDER